MKFALPAIGSSIVDDDAVSKSTAIAQSLQFAAKIGWSNLYHSQNTEPVHKAAGKKRHRSKPRTESPRHQHLMGQLPLQ